MQLADLVAAARRGDVMLDDEHRTFVALALKRAALVEAGRLLEQAHGICSACFGGQTEATGCGTVITCSRCGGRGVVEVVAPPSNAGLQHWGCEGR